MTQPPVAPVDPARVRERGRFVDELMRRPALVGWIGVRDPQGHEVEFQPELARELLFSMPAADFAALLRAAGMPALAQRFELGESFARIAAAGTAFGELAESMAAVGRAGITAAQALRCALNLLPKDEIERTPRERYLHRLSRARAARAKHGKSRGRRRR